ncbi:8-oxo-dGTP diphosphatase MutT [Pseudanabaena sp. PCC 6802]|uniref:8-oxo-dGTP diphosphatase MutT n=1 Tax=Pseudanabaena sp. PCC 6802 TaxID=118173 RepID=UPI00036F885E|nr:8-oxo-dGTP diphosphatase MutT [Pseudanabaena sp. PCC 6802]
MTRKYRQIGVAIVWNQERDRILIDRRLPKGRFASYWEFPGGKVEAGEDIAACIRREIREELGIEIFVEDYLIAINHDYDEDLSVALIVHNCLHISGEPQPLECAEVRWVTLEELDRFQLPPANYEIVQALRKMNHDR